MPDSPNSVRERNWLSMMRPLSLAEREESFGLDQDFGLGDHVGRGVLPTPPKKTIFNSRKLERLAKEVDFHVLDQDHGGYQTRAPGYLDIMVKPRDKDISVYFSGVRERMPTGELGLHINNAYARDSKGTIFEWGDIHNKALSRAQLKDSMRQLKLHFPEITKVGSDYRASGIHSRTQTPQYVRLNPKRLGLLPYQEGRAASALSPALKALNKRRPLGIGRALIPIAAAGYLAGKLFANHSGDKNGP